MGKLEQKEIVNKSSVLEPKVPIKDLETFEPVEKLQLTESPLTSIAAAVKQALGELYIGRDTRSRRHPIIAIDCILDYYRILYGHSFSGAANG